MTSRILAAIGLVALVPFLMLGAYLAWTALPWWALAFGVVSVLLIRRRFRATGPIGPVDPTAARWSPTRGGGY